MPGFRPFLKLVAILALALLTHTLTAADVQLAWDPGISPNIAGYLLYSGVTSGVYTQTSAIGTSTSTLVSNLVPGTTYYFVVTAYDTSGAQSLPSNEASYTPNSTPTPSPTPNAGAAQMVSPLPGSTLSSSTITITSRMERRKRRRLHQLREVEQPSQRLRDRRLE
jgi:hypothetical protein